MGVQEINKKLFFQNMPAIPEPGLPANFLSFSERISRLGQNTWTDQEGYTHLIENMSTSYIFNILSMLMSKSKGSPSAATQNLNQLWSIKFKKELKSRNTQEAHEALLGILLLHE